MLAVPLVHSDRLVAVLALYAEEPGAFTEDQSRLLELMTPRLAASLAALTEAEAAAAAGPPRPRRGGASDLRLVKAGT
jgi:GAF domain-containing protein